MSRSVAETLHAKVGSGDRTLKIFDENEGGAEHCQVDNRQVGTGKPGPITTFVQETYFRAVRGQEPRYAEWLTYV